MFQTNLIHLFLLLYYYYYYYYYSYYYIIIIIIIIIKGKHIFFLSKVFILTVSLGCLDREKPFVRLI